MKIRIAAIVFSIVSIGLLHNIVTGQPKITLEDLWLNYAYYPSMMDEVSPMNSGEEYAMLENRYKIVQYDYKTGKKKKELLSAADIDGIKQISSFEFCKDETKALIASDMESIYRHSTLTNYFVYDFDKKTATSIGSNTETKLRLADFSPDGSKIAFLQDNNLYIKDLTTNEIIQLTRDGLKNNIINGAPDWVYEEEFSFSKAFFWAPDGQKLAWIRFDESDVREYSMPLYDSLYPGNYTYKYPKAGEANSLVSVHVYNIETKKTIAMDIGAEKDIYIPRIKFTNEAGTLAITRLNRMQNKLELLFANVLTGESKVVFTETNNYFINVRDNLHFLPDNQQFLLTAESDGWNHMYLFGDDGKLITQLTKGDWEVTDVIGYDVDKRRIYYMSTEESPIDRHLYCVNLDGSDKQKISVIAGTHDPAFSKTYKYYINTFSDGNTPFKITVNDNKGRVIRSIEDNAALINRMKEKEFLKKEFFTFKNSEDYTIHAYVIKPPDFNPEKKYPLFMHVYGGPGMQEVTNSWGWFDFVWYEMLAQMGYVVMCVDNRGTDFRGEKFTKSTYKRMGELEYKDQVEAARYLIGKGYIDKSRVGIQGWSYGGTLSALCLFRAPDVFKMAIAVAPVTNWRYYDNIYTERYMTRPQDNPAGYDDNSPVKFVKGLKGKFLLVHGTADDNVHYQNSMMLVDALVNANKQFDMAFYPNNDHGIYSGRYTRYHLFTKMTKYILDNL